MSKILTGADNSLLRTSSAPVGMIDKGVIKLIDEMQKILKKHGGVGLAAPQIGVTQRIILVETKKKCFTPMINPKILSWGTIQETADEGCLSLPDVWDSVERFQEVLVSFLTKKKEKQIMKFSGFPARIIQHEIDHLDGILFIDRVSQKKKKQIAGIAR